MPSSTGMMFGSRIMITLILVQGTLSDISPESERTKTGQEFIFSVLPAWKLEQGKGKILQLGVCAKYGGHFWIYYSATGHNESHFITPYSHVHFPLKVDSFKYDTYLTHGGILISSNTYISVVVTVFDPYDTRSGVAYVIYPTSSLNNRNMYVASYSPTPDNYESLTNIVAVVDNTSVNVTCTFAVPLIAYLDKLDYYQLTAPEGHELSGCKIEASNPVFVISGSSTSTLPSQVSHGVKTNKVQFNPAPIATQVIGYDSFRFIIPAIETDQSIMVRVLSDKNYNITIINDTSTITDTTKGVQTYMIGTQPACILTSVPIQLVLYNNPFMTLVPGVEQYLEEYSFGVPEMFSKWHSKLVAIIPSSKASGLLLDDAKFVGASRKITLVDEVYTIITGDIKEDGYHFMTHESGSVKFGLLLYSTVNDFGYGYFVGMGVTVNES